MPQENKFTVSDYLVITILWCNELIGHWLTSLSHHTSQILFPDETFRKAYFSPHEIWIFLTKCLAVVAIAVFVDAYNNKFVAIFTVLCFCLCIPIIAVVICISKSAPAAVFMLWTVSAIYVVNPVRYCLIFNQNLFPVRKTARRLVVLFEFIEVLIGKYLIFIFLPQSASGDDKEKYVSIVHWVIFTPILITLITLVDRVKKFVTGDFMKEKGIKSIMQGILKDMKEKPPIRNGRSPMHVTVFGLLLVPALTLAILDVALTKANSDEETHVLSPTLKNIMYLAILVTLPFVEFILTLLPMIKETISEMVSLGTAHVANIVVLTLLIYRLDHMPESSARSNFKTKRDVGEREGHYCDVGCEIPPPVVGWASYLMIDSVPIAATLNNDPNIFFKVETARLFTVLRGRIPLPPNQTNITVKLTVTLQTVSKPQPAIEQTVTLVEKKHHIYIISGNSTYIKFIEVNGTEDVQQKATPQLIFLNTFAEEIINGIPVLLDNEYRINSTENDIDEYIPFPEIGQYEVVDLPVGDVQISYVYAGSDQRLRELLGTDTVVIPTVPFGIYMAIVERKNKMNMDVFKINFPPEVKTTTTMKPVEIKEPDAVQQSSSAIMGASLGIATVGYTHFIWAESPVRLRALIIAGFRVSTSLAGWITEKVVGDTFTRTKAIALLLLQVVTTVWHLVLSWIFETRIKHTFDQLPDDSHTMP